MTPSSEPANAGRPGEGTLSGIRGLRRLQPLQRSVRWIKSQVGGVGWLLPLIGWWQSGVVVVPVLVELVRVEV